MLKKSLITVLFVAVCVFAATGMAQAVQVDGMRSGFGGGTNVPLPTTLHVHVNPGGLGDALIYGYFNGRSNISLFRVVNTSTMTGISAKVRFREGRNSNEILDFYICLSAGDQWTAYVTDGGSTGVASMTSLDTDTPTYPSTAGLTVPFRSGSTGAATIVSTEDTKEGYLEIIANQSWPDPNTSSGGHTKAVATSADCGTMVLTGAVPGIPAASVVDAPNELTGNMMIINTSSAKGMYSYNATALADFTNLKFLGQMGTDSIPTLADGIDGINGVNYALTKAFEYATYLNISASGVGTTIIHSFPTRRLSIIDSGNIGVSASTCAATATDCNGPFADAMYIDSLAAGQTFNSCEDIAYQVFDDKETYTGTTTLFSPSTTPSNSLCNEVNVNTVGLSTSSAVNTKLRDSNGDIDSSYQFGWVKMTYDSGTAYGVDVTATCFPTNHTAICPVGGRVTSGLPVISYELQNVTNGAWSHMLPLRYSTITK